jgi:hypothetical protein
MQLEFEAGFHLVFHAIELLGKDELGEASQEEKAILRLLTPIAKLYSAKQAIAVVSEGLEAFGGAGYVEDTGLPQLLRNTQVLSIWEGTTNILSLDVLRAIRRESAAEPFINDMLKRLGTISATPLLHSKDTLHLCLNKLTDYLKSMISMSEDEQQIGARVFAMNLAQCYAGTLLLEHAEWALQKNKDQLSVESAIRWCSKHFHKLIEPNTHYCTLSKSLAMQ